MTLKKYISILFVSFLILNLIDYSQTKYAINNTNLKELNPIAREALENNYFMLMKLYLISGFTFMAWGLSLSLINRNYFIAKALLFTFLILINIHYAEIVISNHYLIMNFG